MLLIDKQIIELAKAGMIEPFEEKQVREVFSDNGIDYRPYKTISYGVSSAGYDIRLGHELWLLVPGRHINPKDIQEGDFEEQKIIWDRWGGFFWMPPRGFALSSSLEYFRMPDNVLGDVKGKSTYARTAIQIPATPLEPGWHGNATLEVQNPTDSWIRVYAGEGIAQVLFHQLHERPLTTYGDKNGKYQGQTGITLGRV